MTIRAMTPQDYPTLLTIYDQCKLDEFRYEPHTFTLVPLEQDPKRFPLFQASDVYIIEENTTIVGYGAIAHDEIRGLFIHPQYRRKGLGRAMLSFLLNLAPNEVTLYVAHSNHPAKTLYQSFGFTTIHTIGSDYNGQPVMVDKMKRIQPQ